MTKPFPIPMMALFAGGLGGVLSFIFLRSVDPDTVAIEVIIRFMGLALFPVAVITNLSPSKKPWTNGLTMACGTFFGACIAALLPPPSNIWPIAAASWAMIWAPSILVGALTGNLIGRAVRNMVQK